MISAWFAKRAYRRQVVVHDTAPDWLSGQVARVPMAAIGALGRLR
jgi:hypothetical protein